MQKARWGLVALVMIGSAHATEADWLHFSGFGTLEVDESGNRDADYRVTTEESSGVGRTTGRSSGPGSVFGVQADGKLSEDLTVTAQVVSRKLSDNTANPYFEWANLRYQVVPNLFVRAGRLATNTFLLSESRDVGYSRLTLHLPDVYMTNPITNLDGGDVSYHFNAGPVLYKLNANMGNLNQTLVNAVGTTQFKFKIKGLSGGLEYESQAVRFSYSDVAIDAKSQLMSSYQGALQALIAAGSPGAQDNYDRVPITGYKATFSELAYTYDSDPYLLQTELIHRGSQSLVVQELNGIYVLGGYRLAQWTPYLMYTKVRSVSTLNLPTYSGAGLAPIVANAVNASLSQRGSRVTWSAGTRWDIRPNVDVKFQFDLIDKGAGDMGAFVNADSDFIKEHQHVQVYSAALDFVF